MTRLDISRAADGSIIIKANDNEPITGINEPTQVLIYGKTGPRVRAFFRLCPDIQREESPFHPYILVVSHPYALVEIFYRTKRAEVLLYPDHTQVLMFWPGYVDHSDLYTFTVGELREYCKEKGWVSEQQV